MDCAAIENPKNTAQLENRVSLFATATQPIAASYLDSGYTFWASHTSVAAAEHREAASDCAVIVNPKNPIQRESDYYAASYHDSGYRFWAEPHIRSSCRAPRGCADCAAIVNPKNPIQRESPDSLFMTNTRPRTMTATTGFGRATHLWQLPSTARLRPIAQ